jgi:hypothetical protein
MKYLLPTGSSLMDHPDFYGVLAQPRGANLSPIREGRKWAYDNDCFNGGFNSWQWLATLQKLLPYRRSCLFVVAPDVVGNAVKTKAMWYEWLPALRSMKLPLAFVAQNGQGALDFPEDASWLFVGGDDNFKLGDEGRKCVSRAKEKGMKIHMGRVNSLKRLRYAKSIGCDTVDGTFICFGKDKNTPKLTGMMRTVLHERQLPFC